MGSVDHFARALHRGKAAARRVHAAGFTLAEVLVVLLVIGLAAGLAYARLDSDPRSSLEREARRLGAAMEHAASLAQWRNQVLGVSASGAEYRFWRRETSLDGDRWVPLSDDDVLLAHALPPGVTASAAAYAGQTVAPDSIFPLAPSGRNEPYAIELASAEWRALLLADPLNRVTIAAPVQSAR
jgi:type II secretion system protein H